MASNLRLMCTIYVVSNLVLSIFYSVNSEKCPEYYTLFEESSCDTANASKIKPALINHYNWNISKYEMFALNAILLEYPPEDCFFELVCDHIETVCEHPVYHPTIEVEDMASTTELLMASTTDKDTDDDSTELPTPFTESENRFKYDESSTEPEVTDTTTFKEEDMAELECKQLLTYLEVKACNGGNSTIIKPIAVELDMYSNTSISHYILEDDPSCPFVPLENQFAQLMCEEVTTECVPLNRTAEAITANSTQHTALIAAGSVAAVGAVSALTYYGYLKITEILQSGTYRLPQ